MIDWSRIRSEFPILDQNVGENPLIYFDNAATSQKPRAVIDALVRYYERDNANVHRGLHELSNRATDAYELTRKQVAAFVGASSDEEIIFTRGTTEGINLVAQVLGEHFLKPGDVILLTEMEHHSNLVPWQLAAQRSGATLKHVPITDDGELDLEQLDQMLTPEVKIFSFVHISNSLGTINPAAEMCRKARALGVTTFVDGAQSAGHIPVNVREIGCDFFALSGHKMCAPTGIGALYARQEILAKMPPWQGGGEMINRVNLQESTYKSGPARFEAGTPNIADTIALGAAIQWLEKVGVANIAQRDHVLTQYAMLRLSEIPGLKILGPTKDRGALAAFTLEAAHPHDLVTFANTRGLALRGGHHCTQPVMKKFKIPGTNRASFYFYNTHEEIDRMIDILHEANQFFGA